VAHVGAQDGVHAGLVSGALLAEPGDDVAVEAQGRAFLEVRVDRDGFEVPVFCHVFPVGVGGDGFGVYPSPGLSPKGRGEEGEEAWILRFAQDDGFWGTRADVVRSGGSACRAKGRSGPRAKARSSPGGVSSGALRSIP